MYQWSSKALGRKSFCLLSRRLISLSSVQGKVQSPKIKTEHRLSYEKANNTRVGDSAIQRPQSATDFGNYKRESFVLNLTEEDALKIPSILALHARLNLSPNFEKRTLVRALTSRMEDNQYADNQQMAIFGSNILSYYVTEYLLSTYPRLPIAILKAATEAYIGDFSLHDVAKNQWGIEADTSTNLEKYLLKEPKLFKFGKLRFDQLVTDVEDGITRFNNASKTSLAASTAFANSARAIVAGVYAADGEASAKEFIDLHILSRKVDISSMFEFEEPGKLITRLLRTKNMELPTIRLISETGRQSSSPTFIVGCFSGDSLLGEGQGSSLKEARIRSCVNALKAFYLYRPLDPKRPSESTFKPMFVDEGESFY
ncbi:hypothetical protein OGAPHI_007073 [Ogataea philodendri]|uniref:Large ribosomal subunit protein mL44 n=1 Tax=Ogataea philodendri TaxID=1378263 RepID=A0A9P8NW12_9ASCO|nr:uncharacterized protein OGAPHI_007073 [Ogataea philodendri]KAH3660487.1 hypothetical protein OGAPHI_007073 [Ogataea philodendri]